MLRDDLADATIVYIDAAGLFADFHSLRHSFVSMLAGGNVSPAMAQRLARHSDINLTMSRYTHTVSTDEATALSALPQFRRLRIRPRQTARNFGRPGRMERPPRQMSYRPAYRNRTRTGAVWCGSVQSRHWRRRTPSPTPETNKPRKSPRFAGLPRFIPAEREGFEPTMPYGHSGFQDRCNQPLCHLSNSPRTFTSPAESTPGFTGRNGFRSHSRSFRHTLTRHSNAPRGHFDLRRLKGDNTAGSRVQLAGAKGRSRRQDQVGRLTGVEETEHAPVWGTSLRRTPRTSFASAVVAEAASSAEGSGTGGDRRGVPAGEGTACSSSSSARNRDSSAGPFRHATAARWRRGSSSAAALERGLCDLGFAAGSLFGNRLVALGPRVADIEKTPPSLRREVSHGRLAAFDGNAPVAAAAARRSRSSTVR